MQAILNFDWNVFQFVENHVWTSWLTPIMVFFTKLGDGGILWILIALIFVVTKKYRKVGFVMFGALLVMEVGNNAFLKTLFHRPRPFNLTWEQGELVFPNMVPKPGSFSFPSGHTSAGFAAATGLTLASKKAGFAVPAYIAAAIIGFTRIYVRVHYCTDVIGGVCAGIIYGLIGFVIVNAVYKAVDKRRAKKNAA